MDGTRGIVKNVVFLKKVKSDLLIKPMSFEFYQDFVKLFSRYQIRYQMCLSLENVFLK